MVGIATRNEEGVVKAVVVTQWQWEMQHEIRMPLCKLIVNYLRS